MSRFPEKLGQSSATLGEISPIESTLIPVPMHDVQIEPNWWWKYRYAYLVVATDVN